MPQDWNQIDEEVLDFRVNPYDEEQLALKGLDWTIIDYQSTGMNIQVYFEDPLHISDDLNGKDQLVISVLDPSWFFSSSSLSTIKNVKPVEETLQRQISPDRKDAVIAMEDNANVV